MEKAKMPETVLSYTVTEIDEKNTIVEVHPKETPKNLSDELKYLFFTLTLIMAESLVLKEISLIDTVHVGKESESIRFENTQEKQAEVCIEATKHARKECVTKASVEFELDGFSLKVILGENANPFVFVESLKENSGEKINKDKLNEFIMWSF